MQFPIPLLNSPRRRALAGVAAAAVLLGAGILLWPRADAAQPPVRREYPVQKDTITVGIDAAGSISSQRKGQFTPAAIMLKEYLVTVGTHVSAGDPLAEYDTDDVQRFVTEKKQELDAKQAELDQLLMEQNNAQAKLNQQINQLRSAGSGSPDAQMESLKAEKQAAEQEVSSAQAQADAAIAARDAAQAEKDARPQLLADCDAQISQLKVEEEQLQAELARLTQSGATEEELAPVRLKLADNQVRQSDVQRRRDALAGTDYDALIAQHQSEADSAGALKAAAEAKLPGIEQAISDRQAVLDSMKRDEDTQAAALQNQFEADQKARKAKIQLAEAARDSAREVWQEALSLQADPYLRADCNGVVVTLEGAPGTVMDPLKQAASIADDEKRILRLQVDPLDISSVAAGQEVSFYVDAYPDATFYGKVSAASQLQNESGKFDVEVEYTPGEEPLLEGMGANATLIVKEKKDVLAVSNKAIQFEDGKSFVYLAGENGALKKKEVSTGFSNGRMTEILSGLKEGDIALVEEAYEDR